MKKKTTILLLIACLAVMGASFGITYAYLTSSQTVMNEFTVGENSIEVVEEYDPPEKLRQGLTIDKKVTVKNTGSLPCYVRVRVEFSDSDAEAFCVVDYHTAPGDKWVREADGFYYYTEALDLYQAAEGTEQEKGVTDALFDTVKIRDETEGTYTMIDFDIYVYAESVEQGAFTDYKAAWQYAAGEEGAP